eukprot:733414-Amphidinium_carterae.1
MAMDSLKTLCQSVIFKRGCPKVCTQNYTRTSHSGLGHRSASVSGSRMEGTRTSSFLAAYRLSLIHISEPTRPRLI